MVLSDVWRRSVCRVHRA